MNYYDLLDVPKDASRSDIRKNFLTLSKAFHTDRNPKTGHIFSKINEAYHTLSDDNERRAYDQNLRRDSKFGNTYSVMPFDKHTHSPFPRSSLFDTAWDDSLFSSLPLLGTYHNYHWDDNALSAASKEGEIWVSHYSNNNGNIRQNKRHYRHGNRIS